MSWRRHGVMTAVLALALAGIVTAQDEGYTLSDPNHQVGGHRYAIGVGAGAVEGRDIVVQGTDLVLEENELETFLTLNLRIRFGYGHDDHGPRARGWLGYVEPEIAYWETSGAGFEATNTTLGINLGALVAGGKTEPFFGAGVAVHRVDEDFQTLAQSLSTSDDVLGFNLHAGLDIRLSDDIAFFWIGRVDSVDDDRDDFEGKMYVGLRFGL